MSTIIGAFLFLFSLTNDAQAVCLEVYNPELKMRRPDVIFVPTPPEVTAAALTLGNVGKNDVVYDLGSGDAGVLISAAKATGARGVGLEINPQRIREANESILKNGVSELVQVGHADFFKFDISEATVVFLYLLPSLNVKLLPKLMSELKPGTRIVSHAFDFGGVWTPEREVTLEGRQLYLWTVPADPVVRNDILQRAETELIRFGQD